MWGIVQKQNTLAWCLWISFSGWVNVRDEKGNENLEKGTLVMAGAGEKTNESIKYLCCQSCLFCSSIQNCDTTLAKCLGWSMLIACPQHGIRSAWCRLGSFFCSTSAPDTCTTWKTGKWKVIKISIWPKDCNDSEDTKGNIKRKTWVGQETKIKTADRLIKLHKH